MGEGEYDLTYGKIHQYPIGCRHWNMGTLVGPSFEHLAGAITKGGQGSRRRCRRHGCRHRNIDGLVGTQRRTTDAGK